MLQRVKEFSKNEDGAVTVDWVVLCAGIVVLAVAIVTAMQTGTLGLTASIQSYMTSFFS
jgi:Flp pilus assembly pilin Flp|tara:strand:+ start:6757 stop:6933 length:177 start_codon:yes stop_codon:yes gene_type:complete